MSSYIPILIMVGVATVIAGAMVGLSIFLGPKKPGANKALPYECGMVPVGSARERFPIKFYLFAMLFIIFDVETIFLYPWAVNFHSLSFSLKLFNFVEMAVFVAILFAGYFYILGKGALDWDESARAGVLNSVPPALSAPRPALRFGNEHSGPVDLSKTPIGPRFPIYGASSQEEYQSLPEGNTIPTAAVPRLER